MRALAYGIGILLASTALGGAALADDHASMSNSRFKAEITRTAHNIAHIKADTWEGVGYGVAYAYAQDNICMLAEEFVSVRGERSLYFGPEGKNELGLRGADNLTSDIFFRSQIDLPSLREGAGQAGEATQALMAGYVAGYNRYLFDNPVSTLPKECRDAEWVRPITSDDMLRLTEKTMLLASSLALAGGIANAQPPSSGQASAGIETLTFPAPPEPSYGSNGWAFGSDVTADGKGLLIGNPHFPWEGPARFWQMHVRGPDGYDVMGVGLAGTPIPTLGFNKDVAWTHTVTKARHFTVYMLSLDPKDPTSYMVDGKSVPMEEITVSVPMPGGEEPVERTLYTTQFGPIVTVEGTPLQWQRPIAFALKDANAGNQRGMETWMQMGRATNVGEIETAISESLGIPWVNTIAADREGNALHADITAVPNVSAQFAVTCGTPFSGMVADRVTLLDGTRSACDWSAVESEGALPGLLPASDQASRTRKDYVTNSNDSYWLSHAGEPYRELSPILGGYKTELTLRSRSNYTETEATLAEAPMDHERAKQLVFGNKVLAADLVVDGLLEECSIKAGLAEECEVLEGWDRRVNVESKGAQLFLAFWDKVRGRKDLWATPFDPDNPVNTPRDLSSEGTVRAELYDALVEAGSELEEKGIALNAPWGMVQTRRDGDEAIPIHGASGQAGVLNMQESREVEGGLTPVHGSSYIQIVTFDDDGPVADAILSYSQSSNPASPFYADQTRMYSQKKWNRLPFSDGEIEAARIGETLTISE